MAHGIVFALPHFLLPAGEQVFFLDLVVRQQCEAPIIPGSTAVVIVTVYVHYKLTKVLEHGVNNPETK
jgi:hypothetical protein